MKKINQYIDNSPFLTWCVQTISLCITVAFLLMVSYFIVSCSPRNPERYKTPTAKYEIITNNMYIIPVDDYTTDSLFLYCSSKKTGQNYQISLTQLTMIRTKRQ